MWAVCQSEAPPHVIRESFDPQAGLIPRSPSTSLPGLGLCSVLLSFSWRAWGGGPPPGRGAGLLVRKPSRAGEFVQSAGAVSVPGVKNGHGLVSRSDWIPRANPALSGKPEGDPSAPRSLGALREPGHPLRGEDRAGRPGPLPDHRRGAERGLLLRGQRLVLVAFGAAGLQGHDPLRPSQELSDPRVRPALRPPDFAGGPRRAEVVVRRWLWLRLQDPPSPGSGDGANARQRGLQALPGNGRLVPPKLHPRRRRGGHP